MYRVVGISTGSALAHRPWIDNLSLRFPQGGAKDANAYIELVHESVYGSLTFPATTSGHLVAWPDSIYMVQLTIYVVCSIQPTTNYLRDLGIATCHRSVHTPV